MKKELIAKYNSKEITPIASSHITNNSAIAICHIEYGIDDKVFGFVTSGDIKNFFFVKINSSNDSFRVGGLRFNLSDMMLI